MITPVILAGGSGSRLWPASRTLHPKQFQRLIDDNKSLFQQTLLRALSVDECSDPIIVCNEEHRFLVAEQLRELNIFSATIILEPIGKNTAPAIGLAALSCSNSNSILLVLPADHSISKPDVFNTAIKDAVSLCLLDKLVTFGIVPQHPETGYGYIQKGNPIPQSKGYDVSAFIEKPSLTKAENLFTSNNYLWNSGMFAFSAKKYLTELKMFAPDIYKHVNNAFEHAKKDMDFTRISKERFELCPSNSIDFAIMEHTRSAATLPIDIGWSDVGSWDSLWNVREKDINNNDIKGDVFISNTNNSLIHATSRLVASIGMDNHIIVETADAVLVANKQYCQNIKDIVSFLGEEDRVEAKQHQRVYRPWGWYESICVGRNFQVKHISVKPGASLSLQMHHHRSEHWVVVKGIATVTNGNMVKDYHEDQSTYIPLGNKHRLKNNQEYDLEIIEVQTGKYLGEDDIVRFEDNYGR